MDTCSEPEQWSKASGTLRGDLKVVHSVSWLDPDKGGPAYTVPSLATALSRIGCDSSVLSLGSSRDAVAAWGDDIRRPNDFENWGFLAKLGRSWALERELALRASKADLVHAHGIWMLPAVYAARAANKARIPVVVSPRGMLDPVRLRISSYKKRLFHILYQAQAMQSVRCFHATADSERDHIRSFGMDAPVAIIPNGIHAPEMSGPKQYHSEKRTILSLGRIHPIKGLDRLITAWTDVQKDFPDWSLRIVGPDEVNHSQHLKDLVRSLNASRVSVESAVFGSDKWKLYESCDLFVLPTLSENFAVTVAEALVSELPVISTKGAPWQGLITNSCGWWIDHGQQELVAALRTAMSLDDSERQKMGRLGRAWMVRDFSWQAIARTTAEVYLWLLGRGDRPACVDTVD